MNWEKERDGGSLAFPSFSLSLDPESHTHSLRVVLSPLLASIHSFSFTPSVFTSFYPSSFSTRTRLRRVERSASLPFPPSLLSFDPWAMFYRLSFFHNVVLLCKIKHNQALPKRNCKRANRHSHPLVRLLIVILPPFCFMVHSLGSFILSFLQRVREREDNMDAHTLTQSFNSIHTPCPTASAAATTTGKQTQWMHKSRRESFSFGFFIIRGLSWRGKKKRRIEHETIDAKSWWRTSV